MASLRRSLIRRALQFENQLQFSTVEPVSGKRLGGKVAIITGAAGNIGSATAKLFTSQGATVILTDINDERGKEISRQIGHESVYIHCDVSKEEDIAKTVDFAVEKFGKLDIMYNNAAMIPPASNFQDLHMEIYDKHTGQLMRNVVLGIKHASRVMVPRKKGTILITASALACVVDPMISMLYNINKQNLPGLTKVAASHLGKHGIRVNAISPGAIPAEISLEWFRQFVPEMTREDISAAFLKQSPLAGRHCTAKDIAYGALYLCSDEAGYVNGHNLLIDAGFSHIVNYNPVKFAEQ